MAAASNYAENLVLNWILTSGSATRPTAWHVGLFTSDPTDAGSGTEVSGNAYARQPVAFNAATGTNPTYSDNTATVTFPTASGGNWGTIGWIGIYDADTGGNLLFHGALTASKVVNAGDTFQILANNLVINLA
jgi:hypothetical protein